MPANPEAIRRRLKDFDFSGLLIEELGWDRHVQTIPVQLDAKTYTLQAVAEKRGFAVYTCASTENGRVPELATRQKIHRQAAKHAREHILVFHDAAKSEQVWQWVRREPGKPIAFRHYSWRHDQTNEGLIQRLQAIVVELQDEEETDLIRITGKVKGAFDAEKVTKRFYERFQQEHKTFLKFIQGIREQTDREWYASLMLNRMMFIYFIQKKGFLDNDSEYLRNRLERMKQAGGKGKFHRFYRLFLLRLFHEGLGAPEANRASNLAELLGKVPYLNGGLFDPHELEIEYPKIEIPDEAFECLFDFFDAYRWNLDERPLRADNEINPDVLGYIFEKFINQKEMGAYYTKEDITGYIARNTVIPHLFDVAGKECPIAFKPDGGVWRLLRDNPDRYMWPSVRLGVIDDDGNTVPETALPDYVQKGMHDPKARTFDRRYNLAEADFQDAAGNRLTLPTETWREYVTRRQRCLEIREKLQSGEVKAINDFITYNLDLCQFAEDAISNSEGPELVRAFWKAIRGISVLDPTCGSGAFLFAALNILEPLYEACLGAMQGFLEDLERRPEKHDAKKLGDFRKVLDEASAAKHANQSYFILKSIVLGNLYGVDIMAEAVEICKLRLFLKLVAQLERYDQIEPLPDIDFNIRAGNTLVGFTSLDAVQQAMTEDSDGQQRAATAEERKALRVIQEEAEIADRAFRQFHDMQTERGMDADAYHNAKAEVRKRLAALSEQLDHYLAVQYEVDPEKPVKYEPWRAGHLPFHWLSEFYGIMQRGGFDVIIGNPPYVELKELGDNIPKGYVCKTSGNLYALVIERCLSLGLMLGRQGFIVPVSSVSTDRYEDLQRLLRKREDHFSSYDDRPSRLFDGLEHIRLTIHLIGHPVNESLLLSTRYNKWMSDERGVVFDRLAFVKSVPTLVNGTFPKLCSEIEHSIIRKLAAQGRNLSLFYRRSGKYSIFYSRKVGYFLQVLDFQPNVFDGNGRLRPPSEFKELNFDRQDLAKLALCCLNANLFYWFVTVFSDCRHVNKREVDAFPIDLESLAKGESKKPLLKWSDDLMSDLKHHSENRTMRFGHDTLTIQCLFPKASKDLIDSIDTQLGRHLGLEDAELDFIVNYDVKYRMGQEAANGER